MDWVSNFDVPDKIMQIIRLLICMGLAWSLAINWRMRDFARMIPLAMFFLLTVSNLVLAQFPVSLDLRTLFYYLALASMIMVTYCKNFMLK